MPPKRSNTAAGEGPVATAPSSSSRAASALSSSAAGPAARKSVLGKQGRGPDGEAGPPPKAEKRADGRVPKEDVNVPVAPSAPPPADVTENDQVRGITRRDRFAWMLFRALARGDFKHDFGENVASRDKFDKDDENRFFEIAKLVSKKGSVELRAKFKSYIGKNPYLLIADQINGILPNNPVNTIAQFTPEEYKVHAKGVASFAKEDELLDLIGLNWVALKRQIEDTADGVEIEGKFAEAAVVGGRTYKIRACPYRKSLNRSDTENYKTNRAPIEALKLVSGGKTDFALIVDASGGFPLSDLRDRTLLTGAGGGKVYIIENIENGADSATKLLPPPLKPKNPSTREVVPDLKFLRDDVNTVNYPLWAPSRDDQKSNIYSSFFIILNRISEDNVEANLIMKDAAGKTKESYSIGDIANTSNVKNSSLYTLALMIEKGGITNEMLIYTLIKRMGDWCQALSLLDLDRKYTIYNDDRTTPSPRGGQTGGATTTTLRELQATTEIGIVTNDRILLAFCILLGLNVFYTSAMDIARLIYFKNTSDLPSGPALAAIVVDAIASLGAVDVAAIKARVIAHENAILAARDAFIAARLGTNDIADYILLLRLLLSNLGRLRLDFANSIDQIEANAAIVLSPAGAVDDSKKLTAVNVFKSVMAKIDIDIKYNESVLTDLEDPMNLSVDGKERIRLAALKQKLSLGTRILKSVEVTEAKEILSQTRNDILQILGKQDSLVIGMAKSPPELDDSDEAFVPKIPLLRADIFRTTSDAFGIPKDGRSRSNYDELLSVFPAIKILLPGLVGGQKGGALAEDITAGYDALRTRTIGIINPPPPRARDPEVTSTSNIYKLGTSYYDSALNAYSVVDEYIITKDDLLVFDKVFKTLVTIEEEVSTDEAMAGADAPPTFKYTVVPMPNADTVNKLKYMCVRYNLLVLDMALDDLDTIGQELTENVATVNVDGEEDEDEQWKRVGMSVDDEAPIDEDPLKYDAGLLEKGTPTYARLARIMASMRKIQSTSSSTDDDEYINRTLIMYASPPEEEEVRDIQTVQAEILNRLREVRQKMRDWFPPSPLAIAATLRIEQRAKTNIDTFTGEILPVAGFAEGTEELKQLQGAISSAASSDIPYIGEPIPDAELKKRLVDSIIFSLDAWFNSAAVPYRTKARTTNFESAKERLRAWALGAAAAGTGASSLPLSPPSFGARTPTFGKAALPIPVPPGAAAGQGPPTGLYAATGTGTNASPFGSPFGFGRGGRRGLYEGLRKRGGAGGAPEL